MPRAIDSTGYVVMTALLVVAGAIMVVVQARTRLRRWSVPAGIAGVAMTLVVGYFWPWPVLRANLVIPDWAATDSALRLRGDSQNVEYVGYPEPEVKWRTAHPPITLRGIEPDWQADVRIGSASLDLGPNVRLTSRGFGYAPTVALEGEPRTQRRVVLSGVLGTQRLAFNDSTGENTPAPFVFWIRESEFQRYAPAAGLYRGNALVDLTRKEIVATLPLRLGQTYEEGAYRFVIDEVRRAARPLTIRARLSGAVTMFDRRATPAYTFFLRNRRLSEAVGGYELSLRNSLPLYRWAGSFVVGSVGGFTAGASSIHFPEWGQPKSDPIKLSAGWLDDAELVIVRDTLGGSVSRVLEMPDFPFRVADVSR